MPDRTDKIRVDEAIAALFPPETRIDGRSGGTVCHDAAENLDAALIDLEARGADAVCCRTIKHVIKQIEAARVALST